MFELYTDEAALVAHSSSDAIKNLLGALSGLVTDSPIMAFTTPVEAKGVEV